MKLLFLILIPSFLFGQDGSSCKEIRLDAPGMPLEHIPIQDQDGLNICDHFTAALSIDAQRFYSNGGKFDGHVTSPLAMSGILTSKFKESKNLEDLFAEDILANVSKIGSCNNDVVIKHLEKSTQIDFCADLKYALDMFRLNPKGSGSSNPNSNNSCKIATNLTQGGFSGIALLSKFLNSGEDLKSIASELMKVCEGNVKKFQLKLPIIKEFGANLPFANPAQLGARKAKFKSMLDQALSGPKPMPAGIRYCMHVLKDPNFKSLDGSTGEFVGKCVRENREGGHSSGVIGRRPAKNGKGCEYLVRNSHGVSCSKYSKDWECDQTKGGQPCPAGTQCGGQIWVNEDALLDNVQDVFYTEAL